MRRSSDWLLYPEALGPLPSASGGVWTTHNQRHIHRTLLPLLSPDQLDDVGPPMSSDDIPDVDPTNLRPYQIDAAHFCRERDGSLLALAMGCVTGDTRVWRRVRQDRKPHPAKCTCPDCGCATQITGHFKQITIQSLWDSTVKARPVLLSCDPTGKLVCNEACGLVSKGLQPVVNLVLKSGRALTLTPDHKVATRLAGGLIDYRPAVELHPGNAVVTQKYDGCYPTFHAGEDRVAAVEPAGQVEVFDLAMEDPHHNFVANDIVIANCGKTRTALYATHRTGTPRGLVVSPKVAFDVWRKEIALVYGPDFPVHLVRGQKHPDDLASMREPGIFVINPELVLYRWSDWLSGPLLDFTILDEAHLYTRGGAKRSQSVAALANRSRQRIALTGTPILRHVMDLHGIAQAVSPGAFGPWAHMALWLGFRRGTHGWDLGPIEPAARDRLERRLSEWMVSARWEDVADDVPPLQREMLPLDLDPADRAEYDRLASDVREVLGASEVTLDTLISSAAAGLIQVSALRHFVGRKKIDHVVQLVQGASEPVVVWAWHRDTARDIARQLRDAGLTVSLVTGEDKDSKRSEAIAAFQGGLTDVFVGTIAVGGVGIDLTRARITVMAELAWLPAEIAQAEARVFRSGQTRPCVTYWPVFSHTIENRIIEVLIAKADHARSDIFPEMAAKVVGYDPATEMVSLLEHAMQEDDEV